MAGGKTRGATDWKAVAALEDKQVLHAAQDDPDLCPLDGDELAKMQRVSPVKVLRQRLQMTQSQFSDVFGIPLGTLRDWEQLRSRPDATARSLLRAIDREPATMRRLLEPAA